MELVPNNKRIVPVGRLDMYTSGVLILSNDGSFVYKVTHPSKKISKTYVAEVRGKITKEDLYRLENGIEIENYITSKAIAKLIKYDKEKDISTVEITIHEGRNRQVRKMFDELNKPVILLNRSKIEFLEVGNLKKRRI